MAKIDIALQMLREQFTEALCEAFAERFEGLQIETTWNVIAMRYASERVDGKRYTDEQIAFLAAFETAWLKASNIVAGER
jgi:hypothetical protein